MIIDFENNVDQTGLINKIYNFKSKQIIKAFNNLSKSFFLIPIKIKELIK